MAGDWTLVVHYAADSQVFLKSIKEIPNIYSVARLSARPLSELIAELPPVEWKVGTWISAAREVGELKTVPSGITTSNRKAVVGASTRLIDAAAATVSRGDAFVDNLIESFCRGCLHLAPGKIGSDIDEKVESEADDKVQVDLGAVDTEQVNLVADDDANAASEPEKPIAAQHKIAR